MDKFMREAKGAISVFLIIVLLPMMTMAGVFIDLARSKLAQEVVVSSADLALNTVLTDYDKDLKDYFGLLASCTDTQEVIDVSKGYFKDCLISAGFQTSEAEMFVDNVVSAFVGDEDIQDMLQLSVEGDVDITRTANGALNNTALLKEGINEFMKYRSPVNGVAALFSKIKDANVAKQLEDATAETKLLEAREAFGKAEKELLKQAKKAYKAIKAYEGHKAHTGDLVASEGFLNKFSAFLIDPLGNCNLGDQGNQLANTIGRDWEAIYKDAHVKLTMNLFNTHNTTGTLSVNLIKPKYYSNPGPSTTYSDTKRADAGDIKDLLKAFNDAVVEYYKQRSAVNSAWSNTGSMASGDWPIQYWVKLSKNCTSSRDAYVKAARKVWELGNKLDNALSYLEEDVFKNTQMKCPTNSYVTMPKKDTLGMASMQEVKDALWNDYKTNIYPEVSGSGCSGYRNVNSQANSLDTTTNNNRLKHTTVSHIYNVGSELGRFVADAEKAETLLKTAREAVEGLSKKMDAYKTKFDAWKTAAYDPALNDSTLATGRDGDRELIEEYEKNGLINISNKSVTELAGRIENSEKLFGTLAKDMRGIKYNGTSVVNVYDYNSFRKASKLDASKIPVNESALRSYADQTFSFSIGTQIQRIEIRGGTSDTFDGGNYYFITDSFHPVLTKPKVYDLYDWLKYKFENTPTGNALNMEEHGFDVTDEDSAEKADEKIEGKADSEAKKASTTANMSSKNFKDFPGATLPSKNKNAPNPKSISTKLSDAADYVSDLFSDFGNTFRGTLENTRDDLYAEDYIFSMFTHDTFEKEGCFSLLSKTEQDQLTPLTADAKYKTVKEKWTGSNEVKTLTLTPRNAENNWCYGGEIEYILYGQGTNAGNKTSAYSNIYMIRYALDLKPVFSFYWNDPVVVAVATALERFAFIPAVITKTLICLAITAGEAAMDIAYLKQGIPVLILKSKSELFCDYTSIFVGGNKRANIGDGPKLQYSDYLKMFLFINLKSDENQVYIRTADVIQSNMYHVGNKDFDMSKAQVFYTLHADVIMEPMWSRLLAIDDLGDLSTAKGWRTISITLTNGY